MKLLLIINGQFYVILFKDVNVIVVIVENLLLINCYQIKLVIVKYQSKILMNYVYLYYILIQKPNPCSVTIKNIPYDITPEELFKYISYPNEIICYKVLFVNQYYMAIIIYKSDDVFNLYIDCFKSC